MTERQLTRAEELRIMTTPEDLTVTPRDLHFHTQAAGDPAWLGGNRVGTAVYNALSLTFPEGERVFIDAVRAYRPQLTANLLDQAKAFIAQEAIHTREHVAMNKHIDRDHYPIAEIEADLARKFAMLRDLGPVAMLGSTIALEHFTAMMADWSLDNPQFWQGVPDDLARLWRWHAMEESEHKAVAFDVFGEIAKGWTPSQRYRFRVRVMALTTLRFTSDIARYAAMLLVADGAPKTQARLAVLNFLFGKPGLLRKSWRAYWDWYRPGFHPWDHDNRAKLELWRRDFPPPAAA
jgi:predicted metal-dependent hydrolase